METNISKWLRIFLGLFLIVYALNQFLHVIPAGYTDMPDDARDFLDAVVIYLPLLYVFEIITGLFLIFNKWTALILIMLFPLSVSFLIFTFANQDLSETWPAVLVAGLNFTLLISSRERYKPLFE